MPVPSNHHYLDFTRKYRRGTFVLILIILLLCAVPFVYPLIVKPAGIPVNIDSSLAVLRAKKPSPGKNYGEHYKEDHRLYDQPSYPSSSYKKQGDLFYFDPNTIGSDGWKKLGLRDKTIAVIMNYRNKGGKFKQAADIKKIWGLFPDEAERLMPFVNIETKEHYDVEKKYPANDHKKGEKFVHKKIYSNINVNAADTVDWARLPGIGSKLSLRIVTFREKLGGFYSIEQVGETFGLTDSVFQKVKQYLLVSGEVKKININTATLEQLKGHPYIRYNIGNLIIQYRLQHGAFKKITDIKKIMVITEEIFNKVSPYLSVE